MSKYDINAYPASKLVCDPFDGNQSPPSPENGIRATLYYETPAQPRFYDVMSMITKTTMSNQNLFFTDLNTPTRMFTSGFSTLTSDVVKDDNGNTLLEYFGLKFNTEISLAANDPEGLYEFMILSDDGSVLNELDSNSNVKQTIVSNDGGHPTRMGCSSKTYLLRYGDKISVELLYFQGPRYHIANVLMWRLLKPANSDPETLAAAHAGQDEFCGKQGNDFFFNPADSSPTSNYIALTNRGWKPLAKDNFFIPRTSNQNSISADYNACFQGSAPLISNFLVTNQEGNIEVSWTTDILSTSQLLITEVTTGQNQVTDSDNILRLNHQLVLKNLKPSTHYKIQAISVSQDLGRTISASYDLVTP